MRLALTSIILSVMFAATALAETHEVKMLNANGAGAMVYEPDYLVVAPGDTVRFVVTVRGHNAATIDGFMPEGAQAFKGQINQEIEVTFTVPGFYGIKCSPHYDMGMVMLIQVGQEPASSAPMPATLPKGAAKRFSEIVERARAPSETPSRN